MVNINQAHVKDKLSPLWTKRGLRLWINVLLFKQAILLTGGTAMDVKEMKEYRKEYNLKLVQADGFFKEFGELDDKAYSDGAIDKKHKELMGLAISVVSRCNECICYHIEGCLNAGAGMDEIMEAIKIGVIGGGSITYPNARFAVKALEEFISKE